MRKKLFEMISDNKNYSFDDFNKEFAAISNSVPNANNDYKIKLKIKNLSNNPIPEYATVGSSGFDLRAYLSEPVIIPTGKKIIVPTGLFFEIPENFEIQIRPRSGLAAKNGVTVLNSPGTIDADYRGEIKVILINHGDEDFVINNGDRIAQGVISAVLNKNIIELEEVNTISDNTSRSSGGFGSTGIQ